MRLAMVQMKDQGTLSQNLKKSLLAIRDASQKGADLILFPEVHLSYFFPQYPSGDASASLISFDSEIIQLFRDACRENHIMASPNFYYAESGKKYDASFFIDSEGTVLGIQKMVHVAQAPHFYEQDYYTPSDTGFQLFDTLFGKIGIVICFDRHYPESMRTEALMGADLILIPTANTLQEPMDMFEMEIRVQAFQNSVFAAMCNRVGKEGKMIFAGESIIVSPDGDLIVKGGSLEQILYADINLQEARARRSEKSYTSLRQTEFYL